MGRKVEHCSELCHVTKQLSYHEVPDGWSVYCGPHSRHIGDHGDCGDHGASV